MKDIVAHCDKTIVKTEDNIKDTETHLKNITEREKYQSIEKPIKNNEANTKHLLQKRKFKKFNYLKYQQNKIQQLRKHHNPLNTKQYFKKYMQVLYKVLTTLTPIKYH